jgi:hypothetical protein
MKARIVDNTIVEIITPIPGFSLEQCFHPDILAACIDIPEGASVGWQKNDQDEWVAPPAAPRTWGIDDVRSKLTFAEKTKWDNDVFHEIVTAKIELATPKHVTEVTEILTALVIATAISRASMDAILA